MIGIVEQLIQSRDGKVLRVVVKYVNTAEFPVLQFTDRAVRQLVKIFNVEEYVLHEDLTELLRRLDANKMDEAVAQRVGDQNPQASGIWLLLPIPSFSKLEEEESDGYL